MKVWFSHLHHLRSARPSSWVFLGLILLISGCKSSEYRAYSYDPVGATLTEDKPLDEYHRRTIGFIEDGVWFTNEFEGARLNNVVRLAPYRYELTIAAENTPINNSAWYAFAIARGESPWSLGREAIGHIQTMEHSPLDSVTIWLRIRYNGGSHRYQPKILEYVALQDGGFGGMYTYREIDSLQTSIISTEASNNLGLELRVSLGNNPVLITAQPLENSTSLLDTLQDWTSRYASVTLDTAGFSSENRLIPGLTISHDRNRQRPTVMVIGRQHPPEVPGYEVMRSFLKRIAEDDSLSNAFLDAFHVVAIPMANPDGVDRGHWRHNARGVDLNRDWIQFNQQETQVARRYFLEKAEELGHPIYAIDFHSTQIHLMYPIDKSVPLQGPSISTPWFENLLDPNTGYPFEVAIEPFDTSGPVAKNWFWREFGIDALTYEVSDSSTTMQNDQAGTIAAKSLMKLLLDIQN